MKIFKAQRLRAGEFLRMTLSSATRLQKLSPWGDPTLKVKTGDVTQRDSRDSATCDIFSVKKLLIELLRVMPGLGCPCLWLPHTKKSVSIFKLLRC